MPLCFIIFYHVLSYLALFDAILFDSIRFDCVRLCSIRFDSILFCSVLFCFAVLCSITGHACRLAASFPRERRMGSSSAATLRGGEACEPGVRLGPNPSQRQVQRTGSVSEWNRSAWLCATRACQPGPNPNGRRCWGIKVNWAELLSLQGDFAPHHYLSQHDKPLRRPKSLVDLCCASGCAPASRAPQRGAPQHKCWRAPAVPASTSPKLSASDGEDTIFGSFQALDPTPPPSPVQMRPRMNGETTWRRN